MPKLLVVDDEQSICWGLTRLGEELGHQVWTASSAEDAIELLDRHRPDVIVLDVRLPGMSGLDAMEQFRQRTERTPIIVITAYGDLTTAVTAVKNGAFEYIVKPFDLDKVQRALTRAFASQEMQYKQPRTEFVGGLIGRSAAMQEVFTRIALAAASDISVLLSGESGTGKELAARAIHRYSDRAEGPFVAVNVAALSASLAEGELFGHVRGAFTGADQDRTGLLVQANGGTLFLDEVADIPLSIQVKLLRALEHQEVLPIGSNQVIATNFRVISASHRDLSALVQRGDFRHDLYFRLCAFEIAIPPLRLRLEDLPELANYFLAGMTRREEFSPRLSNQAISELCRRPWHGNVRELRNAVEHAAMLARGGSIEPEHFPPLTTAIAKETEGDSIESSIAALVTSWVDNKLANDPATSNLHEQLMNVVERPLFLGALQKSRHQCAAAARMLGLHRTTVRKKIDEYGIEAD